MTVTAERDHCETAVRMKTTRVSKTVRLDFLIDGMSELQEKTRTVNEVRIRANILVLMGSS